MNIAVGDINGRNMQFSSGAVTNNAGLSTAAAPAAPMAANGHFDFESSMRPANANPPPHPTDFQPHSHPASLSHFYTSSTPSSLAATGTSPSTPYSPSFSFGNSISNPSPFMPPSPAVSGQQQRQRQQQQQQQQHQQQHQEQQHQQAIAEAAASALGLKMAPTCTMSSLPAIPSVSHPPSMEPLPSSHAPLHPNSQLPLMIPSYDKTPIVSHSVPGQFSPSSQNSTATVSRPPSTASVLSGVTPTGQISPHSITGHPPTLAPPPPSSHAHSHGPGPPHSQIPLMYPSYDTKVPIVAPSIPGQLHSPPPPPPGPSVKVDGPSPTSVLSGVASSSQIPSHGTAVRPPPLTSLPVSHAPGHPSDSHMPLMLSSFNKVPIYAPSIPGQLHSPPPPPPPPQTHSVASVTSPASTAVLPGVTSPAQIPTNGAAVAAVNSCGPLSPAHSTTKKHKCKVCEKRFTRPSSLQTHMYSHTGEKPYACDFDGCGRHFSVVSNLRRHKRVHRTGQSAASSRDHSDNLTNSVHDHDASQLYNTSNTVENVSVSAMAGTTAGPNGIIG